ncbi:MAG TPA: DUF885 family protein [Steroidobacteraceae bacterium]|jgi:uncharacterized protein (DUF885 family)|nr:DUF885 family protein [Steroidobacteraceae bacterium]
MLRKLLFASLFAISSLAGAADRATELRQLYDEFWEENLKLNPLTATFAGDPRYNAELPNMLSLEYHEQSRAFHQKYLDRARAIGPEGLTGQDQLSFEIFTLNRESALEEFKFPERLLPIDQFYNIANLFAQLGSGAGAQPFATVKDYDDWLKRAARAPVIFEQAIVNMREGMKVGLVQPRVLMEKVLPQLDANIADDVEKSIFWGPVAKMPADFSAADRERLTTAFRNLIGTQITPAYRKLRAFVADEYLPKCRETFGRGGLPNGADWYAHNVRDNTMRSMTPAQVHQIGLEEVARIQNEMRQVAKDLGYPRPTKTLADLKAFFEWVKSRDDMYFKSKEELLAAYQAFGANVAPVLPKYFNLRPKTDYEVRLVEPFREASASSGQYQGPSLDGKRPGIFYVNSYDLKARPRSALASLSLHEAAPGHHFQISLQRELKDLPMFRRFSRDTAYIEGWGLYAEYLGYEMGIYKDPVARFGALDAELWRAIRLVTDTGIHYKGWTRQQTLDYMLANSPAEMTRAVSEAERFAAIPGQALAYKIGQLKIVELRKRAEKALGPKFRITEFHDEVLKDGAVPLEVLESKIDRWIASKR